MYHPLSHSKDNMTLKIIDIFFLLYGKRNFLDNFRSNFSKLVTYSNYPFILGRLKIDTL